MESFFTRFKNSLALIAVLLAQTVALAVQVRRPADSPDGRQVRLLRLWVTAAVTPFERASHGLGSGVRNAWFNYIDLRHVRQEDRDLRARIAQLRLQQAALAQDALQGQRLQTLLRFQQHYIASTVAAQVIGTSGSDQSRMLIIDKGSHDGLKPDMPVITPDGVVGKLRDVFPSSAQVLELDDPTSGAGVLLASTRIRGILRGTPTGRIQIVNLTADSRIHPGDQVLTSGGDQVYPRGLPIGTIESIVPDPDHQPYTAIQIRPAANLSQLEEVLIITGTQTSLSPQTEQDLADDARAAANHLPTLNPSADPSGTPGAPSGPETPASPKTPVNSRPPLAGAKPLIPAVPKPVPTVHPDRFSPGTSPPAADLTPGAQHVVSSPAQSVQMPLPAHD